MGLSAVPVKTETALVGLFTAEPGRDAFDKSHVLLMERQPIRLRMADRKPLYVLPVG